MLHLGTTVCQVGHLEFVCTQYPCTLGNKCQNSWGQWSDSQSIKIKSLEHSISLGSFVCVYVCVLSHVWFFGTPCIIARQAHLSMRFCRQEYWRGLPLPPPEDLPNSEIKPTFPVSPLFLADSLLLEQLRKPYTHTHTHTHTYTYIYTHIDIPICRPSSENINVHFLTVLFPAMSYYCHM